MSLSDISLPGTVIADLYRNSLVQTEPLKQSGNAATRERESKSVEATGIEPVSKPIKSVPREAEAQKPAPRSEKTQTPANNYKILGNNQQQVTIIVNFENEAFIPDKHLQFLTKMLEACKLNLGDVAIVNHAKKAVDMEILKQQLNPSYVLLFGVEPVELKMPLNFPQFKEQAFAGSSYLYTPSLENLNQDTEEGKLLKSKLWVCLKKLFKV